MKNSFTWLSLQVAKIDPRHIQLFLMALTFVVFIINGPMDDVGGGPR
jgi:hypothetical protein